jgi:hypothetical protein
MTFQVIINTSAFERAVERQVAPMMEADLNEIKAIIAEQADAPKSGRQYRDRRRSSAAGESPARQSGSLVDSITEPDVRKAGNVLIGEIRIVAPHAILLQRGTGRIAPRPISRPAVDEFLRRRA